LQDSLAAHPDASVVARIVLHGLRGSVVREGRTYHGVMPPQATVLADAEIAAVVNYVRETWGRSDPVNTCSPETVAALRHKFAGRNSPWSRAELLAAP
jgi:mono/diheme cytochrome c family protein